MRRPARRGPRASGGGSARWGLCPPESDASRRSGRAWALDRPLLSRMAGRADGLPAGAASPPRRDEDRCSRPDVSRKGAGLQAEGLSPALPSAHRPALIPLFREAFQGGGTWRLPVMRFVITKVPLGRVLADGPNGGESGHMPPASRPRVRGRAAGEYVAVLHPLLGHVGRSPMGKSTKNRHRPGRSSP
jgi:hypothetical protein